MGLLISKVWSGLFGNKDYKIVIIGLNNAGKSTILYALHLGEVVVTQPTIGSNVEEIQHKNINLVCWDLGGQESLRPDWGLYYADTQAVVMVVDSADVERLPVVKEELFHMLEHPDLKSARILVYANKQVLPFFLLVHSICCGNHQKSTKYVTQVLPYFGIFFGERRQISMTQTVALRSVAP